MVEIMPSDGAGQFAVWKRSVDRQLAALSTMRRTPYTDIYDEDGNLLGKLSAEGLAFFDIDGDPTSSLDGEGITVYDGESRAMTADGEGLVVYDDGGVAQLRAGHLGGGNYGVEIGGGRARAMNYDFKYNLVSNASLTSTEGIKNTITITPPSWATITHVTGQLGFQMANTTGSTQRMYFRVDVDGVPGSGLWSNWVAAGMTSNTYDTTVAEVVGNSPFNVTAVAGVNVGTNNNNHLRLSASAIFLR